MACLIVLHETVHDTLCHREVAVTTLVGIEHSIGLFHVELRLNSHLRTAVAIVVIHLEVDQQLPVTIGRTIGLQRIRTVPIVLQKFVELGAFIVSGTHLQVSLSIFLAGLGKVPILVGHIVGSLVLDHSASVLVELRLDVLLVLHEGVVLGLRRKTHGLVLGLFPL